MASELVENGSFFSTNHDRRNCDFYDQAQKELPSVITIRYVITNQKYRKSTADSRITEKLSYGTCHSHFEKRASITHRTNIFFSGTMTCRGQDQNEG